MYFLGFSIFSFSLIISEWQNKQKLIRQTTEASKNNTNWMIIVIVYKQFLLFIWNGNYVHNTYKSIKINGKGLIYCDLSNTTTYQQILASGNMYNLKKKYFSSTDLKTKSFGFLFGWLGVELRYQRPNDGGLLLLQQREKARLWVSGKLLWFSFFDDFTVVDY